MCRRDLRLTIFMAIIGLAVPGAGFAADLTLAQADTSAAEQKAKLVDLWSPGDAGQRMNIRGRVTSLDGTALAGISISIRQANGEGDYTSSYRTRLETDSQGRYQFGSVVPGNYAGAKHVHVSVYHEGFQYYNSSILFEGDPYLEQHYEDGTAIFLEESSVNGETIMFGRFDIMLTPE